MKTILVDIRAPATFHFFHYVETLKQQHDIFSEQPRHLMVVFRQVSILENNHVTRYLEIDLGFLLYSITFMFSDCIVNFLFGSCCFQNFLVFEWLLL